MKKCPGYLFNSVEIHCAISNNRFLAVRFGLVRVGHGFINRLASDSFVVSFS